MTTIFLIFFIMTSLLSASPNYQPQNTAFFHVEREESGIPVAYLFKCNSITITSGAYASLGLVFSGQNKNGDTTSFYIHLLSNEKFDIHKITSEEGSSDTSENTISLPLVLTDGDFKDMHSCFGEPIFPYLMLETVRNGEAIQTEILYNFTVTIYSITFNDGKWDIELEFTGDNFFDSINTLTEIYGIIKISDFPSLIMMVD